MNKIKNIIYYIITRLYRKRISYYIMSHIDYHSWNLEFQYPILPPNNMGKLFNFKVKLWMKIIRYYIRNNKNNYKSLRLGIYNK